MCLLTVIRLLNKINFVRKHQMVQDGVLFHLIYNLMNQTKMKCCYCSIKYFVFCVLFFFFHMVIVNVMYFYELNHNGIHVLYVKDPWKHTVIVTSYVEKIYKG